jgi:hypothetical protein
VEFAAGALLGLAIVVATRYGAYWWSSREVARVYRTLAHRWKGMFRAGTYLRPPVVEFAHEGLQAQLSSFYLHRGDTGNYTQLRFDLGRSYLDAFVVRPDDEAKGRYRVESVSPELAERLLVGGWAEALDRIGAMTPGRHTEVRFDGDTLVVRTKALLLVPENLTDFRAAAGRILAELTAGLGTPLPLAGD